MANEIENVFEKAGHVILIAAEAAKKGIILAGEDAEAVGAVLSKDSTQIESLAADLGPKASAITAAGLKAVGQIASALESGGAAAEQNLLNSGLDATLIAAVKAVVPLLKGL